MAQITAALVKDLRDRTGAGMMDAKKALVENDGDMETAIDWLRSKGLSKAAKKSGRTAADGLVSAVLSSDGKTGALVELNAETDFVARNEKFQVIISTTGFRPAIAIPIAAPVNPPSAIGTSITRFGPN